MYINGLDYQRPPALDTKGIFMARAETGNRWGRWLFIGVACALLGALTARGSSMASGLRIFLVLIIVCLFFAAFLLVELVPGWRRTPSLLARPTLIPLVIALALISGLYTIFRSKINAWLGGTQPPWLPVLAAFAVFVIIILLKRRFIRR